MSYVICENNKQLDYKQMSIIDIIEYEAKNIEYTACLWYCYLIHEFFHDSYDKFYNFVNRVKNDSKLSKNDIELVQLCLSESLLRRISTEKITVSSEQIKQDEYFNKLFTATGAPIKSSRVNIYTRIKDQLLTHFKYCEDPYLGNKSVIDTVLPHALEAVMQHDVENEECQKVKIQTLYFPRKDTFKFVYTAIQNSFKLFVNDECRIKLTKLFNTFNLKLDDVDFSRNMAKVKHEREMQDVYDSFANKVFNEAVYNEDIDIFEFLEETTRNNIREISRKSSEESEFLKKLKKLGDAIINSKSDSDEPLFEKHKSKFANQDEEDYWYLYDQFHDNRGNYHDYSK